MQIHKPSKFPALKDQPECFGGSLLKSNPKRKRPLSAKLPIHVVLRSALRGTKTSMRALHNYGRVTKIVHVTARKHGVKIYEYGNAGNHLHLVLKIPHRKAWRAFIRELSGRIAAAAQALRGPRKGVKFWKARPFTRIVKSWGRAFRILKDYVLLNHLEGAGIVKRGEWSGQITFSEIERLPKRAQRVVENFLTKLKRQAAEEFTFT